MCLINSDYCASELAKLTKFPESCDTLIIKLSAIASVINLQATSMLRC